MFPHVIINIMAKEIDLLKEIKKEEKKKRLIYLNEVLKRYKMK